jgi:hypothetical protein
MSTIKANNIFQATSALGSSKLPPFLPPDEPNCNNVNMNMNLTNMNITDPTNMNLDFNFEDVNSFDLSTSGLGNTYYGFNDFNFNFSNTGNPPFTSTPSPEVVLIMQLCSIFKMIPSYLSIHTNTQHLSS